MVQPRFLSILTGRRLSIRSRELLGALESAESAPGAELSSSSDNSSSVSLEKTEAPATKRRFRLAPSLKRKSLSLLFRRKRQRPEQRPVSSTFNFSHSSSSDRFDDEEWLDFSLVEKSDTPALFHDTTESNSVDNSPIQPSSSSMPLICNKPKSRSRRVRFGSVQVHEHRVILGDSCCKGPPLQLGWERACTSQQSVKSHSTRPGKRPPNRSPNQLRISPRKRHMMLRKAGVSKQSIVEYVEAQKQERRMQQLENELQEGDPATSPCPHSIAEDALDRCLWNADSESSINNDYKNSLYVYEDAGEVFETVNFMPDTTTEKSFASKSHDNSDYPLLDLDAALSPSNYFSSQDPQSSWTFDLWSESFLTTQNTSSSMPVSDKPQHVPIIELSEASKTEEESDEESHRFHSLPVIEETENPHKKKIFSSWKRPLGKIMRRRVRARQ